MSDAANAKRTHAPAPLPGQPAEAADRIAELQVSAHLMTLETGLFCVFQTPGSTQSDAATGLPGVRITPAPGIAGRPEAVSVSTFREDGWLNGTAALVRVTDGSAQILVTIYQHKGMDAAPRLQVLRLSAEPDAQTAPEVPATASPARSAPVKTAPAVIEPVQAAQGQSAAPVRSAAPANPEVMAHVQRMGDVGCRLGDWLGVKGSGQWVEGFGLAPAGGIALEDIEYQAVLGRNWLSPWVEGGKFCGSRGMALPLLGFKVRLKGAAAKAFDCRYTATFVDGSVAGPVGNGETLEAGSLAAVEAFQIIVQPRQGKTTAKTSPAKPTSPAKAPASKPAAGTPAAPKPPAPKAAPLQAVTGKAVTAKTAAAAAKPPAISPPNAKPVTAKPVAAKPAAGPRPRT